MYNTAKYCTIFEEAELIMKGLHIHVIIMCADDVDVYTYPQRDYKP